MSILEFTRGVMDRIRDRCRSLGPDGWEAIDQAPLLEDYSVLVAKRREYKTERERRRHREQREKIAPNEEGDR